jgi:hypothetical protein
MRFIFFFWLFAYSALAQDSLHTNILRIGGQMHYGSVFAHSPAVENTANSFPWGLQMEVNWQRISQKVWDNCHCYPQMGILASYYNYDNVILGKSVQLAYFLEPTFKLSKRTSFSVRGIVGLSYLTNPYDSIQNPNNRSYSLPISAYLTVATGVQIQLDKKWYLNSHLNYQHISNGGIKDPNKGINWITGSLGVLYTINPINLPVRSKKVFVREKELEWEVIGFVSNKGAGVGQKRRFMIGGLSLQANRQISPLHAFSIATEAYWDGALAERLKQDTLNASNFRWGWMLGHAFLLGKFRFTQQIGIYAYSDSPYFSRWYHRWGVIYDVHKKWGIGFNMKAHKQTANFLDLRAIWKF